MQLASTSAPRAGREQADCGTPAVAEHAASLAESGRCSEALPLLAKAAAHITDKELQKRVGLDGVRCATLLQQSGVLCRTSLRMLSRQFPHDPEVLYVLTHAYSDLCAASDANSGTTAPTSIPALEMDADAAEQTGQMGSGGERLSQDSGAKSALSRRSTFAWRGLLLSKPIRPPDFAEQAKKELQQELEIDPANAGAEYVLGELARQAQEITRGDQAFSKPPNSIPILLTPTSGWACASGSEKNYADAVAPLEKAVKLQPANPAGHYSLATAYARTGRKEDAEREFALQQKTSGPAGGQGAQTPQ